MLTQLFEHIRSKKSADSSEHKMVTHRRGKLYNNDEANMAAQCTGVKDRVGHSLIRTVF